MTNIKNAIRKLLPDPLLIAFNRFRMRIVLERYKALTVKEAFTLIYTKNAWGKSNDPSDKYYSGSGSRKNDVVEAYIKSIDMFLRSFPTKPDVVDLGCGDFSVGSRVRALCANYIACDIVEPLIAFNKEKFASLNVDFRVLDITADELPLAEVVFIRQVLQHLSNKMIEKVLPQLMRKYKYLVLTEHLPAAESFPHNLDVRTGPYFRLFLNSGIVLTSPPFNLKALEEKKLCQGPDCGGIIQTTLYRLS